jgi:putative serine protease PepD
MSMTHRKRLIVFTGVAALAGAGGGVAATEALRDPPQAAAITSIVSPAASKTVSSTGALSPEDLYKKASPSVAHITSQGVQEESPSPFGGGGGSTGTATGTGFVVSSSGLIVTNAHVVNGASRVTVKVGDGPTQTATVVGKDESTDLAVLRVGNHDGLVPLPLGESSQISVGDATYAIGDPFGLNGTLTTGVVSALDRSIQSPNGFTIVGAIQTDAALNPGNSGGPLLDGQGEVIGVNAQIESPNSSSSGQGQNSGIGFAVPSDTVRKVVGDIAAGKTVQHAYLGVSTQDTSNSTGARVAQVTSGGPAAGAGLQAGDVITAVGDTKVSDANDLSSVVDTHDPGEQVSLTIQRSGQQRTVSVTLGTRPDRAPGTTAIP